VLQFSSRAELNKEASSTTVRGRLPTVCYGVRLPKAFKPEHSVCYMLSPITLEFYAHFL